MRPAGFADKRSAGEDLHPLVSHDDFSRDRNGCALAAPSSPQVTIDVLRRAIARHDGADGVHTDRGGEIVCAAANGDRCRMDRPVEVKLVDARNVDAPGGGRAGNLRQS